MTKVIQFLESDEWDKPFFKKLSANDTGSSPGHQGGIVIPKDIRLYFPALTGITSHESPTIDKIIKAKLFIGKEFIENTFTRYQFQTWGGTRSPESRLTGNLNNLRNKAHAGDYLIFQRRKDTLDSYKIHLIKSEDPLYKDINKMRDNKWGALYSEKPMTQMDINESYSDEKRRENEDFKLFEASVFKETQARKIARSFIFRDTVLRLYKNVCSVCNTGLETPQGLFEVQAAHIVPKNNSGSDDARNGICLCPRHHWAFDNGLFGVDKKRNIAISEQVKKIPNNKVILDLQGSKIMEAKDKKLKASNEAFNWHYNNIMIR